MTPDLARAIETVLAHPQFQRIQATIAIAETVDDEDALFMQAVETLRAAIDPEPAPYVLPGTGVPLSTFIADLARTHARMLLHDDRADGRVVSPHPVRLNIHD